MFSWYSTSPPPIGLSVSDMRSTAFQTGSMRESTSAQVNTCPTDPNSGST